MPTDSLIDPRRSSRIRDNRRMVSWSGLSKCKRGVGVAGIRRVRVIVVEDAEQKKPARANLYWS